MNITILGGGISAISLAYFIQNSKKIKNIYIIEKEKNLGGLLRSYKFDKIYYDVGPHIIFSKHKDILNWILGDTDFLLDRIKKLNNFNEIQKNKLKLKKLLKKEEDIWGLSLLKKYKSNIYSENKKTAQPFGILEF